MELRVCQISFPYDGVDMVGSIFSIFNRISIEKKSMGNEVFNAYRTAVAAFVASMIMTSLVL